LGDFLGDLKYLSVAIGILFLFCFLVFFLNSSSVSLFSFQGNVNENRVKVGVILPLTGVSSDGGNYALNGLLLAQKEIESNPKIINKVDLIIEDSQFNSDLAVSAFNKLVFVDGVDYIIGDYGSGQTLAITPLAEKSKIILINSASQTDDISFAGDYIFRTEISARDDANFLSKWFFEKYGSKRVGIFECIHDYCVSFDKSFIPKYYSFGGKELNIYKYEMTQTDFKNLILKSKYNGDEVLILLGNSKSVALIMKTAGEMGLNVVFVSTSPVQRQTLIDIGKSAVEGLIYSYAFDSDSNNLMMQNYQSSYFEEYGIQSEAVAANSFDALILLSNCFEKFGVNTNRVKECLYNVKNYSGASGTFSFDKNGDVVGKKFILKTVKNGEFVLHSSD
jgi:branched-chain amino acid transport system substrate-binding protein